MGNSSGTKKKRIFLAVPLEKQVQDKLTHQLSNLHAGTQGFKPVAPGQFHVTLFFFGEMDIETIPGLIDHLEKVISLDDPIHYAWEGLGGFPFRGLPKVIYFNLTRGFEQIQRIQAHLAPLLEKYVPREERSFHPHITAGRCRFGDARPLLRRSKGFKGAGTANHLTLYESVLSNQGAKYIPLAEFR